MLKRVFNTDADRKRKTDEFPVGMVMAWHSSTPPSSLWLLCNGQEAPIGSHFRLYDLITANGTLFPYGANTNGSGGAGSTHFRLPDIRDRFLMSPTPTANNPGTGYVANTGGSSSHEHSVTTPNSAGTSTTSANAHNHAFNFGSVSASGAHNHGNAFENPGTSANNNVNTNVKRAGSGNSNYNGAFESHPHGTSYTTGVSANHSHSMSAASNYTGYNSTSEFSGNTAPWWNPNSTSEGSHTHSVPWTGQTYTSVSSGSTEPTNLRVHFIVYSGGL